MSMGSFALFKFTVIIKYIYLWDVNEVVRSMTGYGINTMDIEKSHVTIEVKSVNHRFLDIKTNLPSTLHFIEENLKKVIKKYFHRGRIEVYVIIDNDHFIKKTLTTDWDLMDQYVEQQNLVKERYNLEGVLTLDLLSSIPELFSVQEDDKYPTQLGDIILEKIECVCRQVQKRRGEEGRNLENDIKNRINSIHNMLLLIEERRPQVINEYQARIYERITEFTSHLIRLDDHQLHKEIALLSEKGDISEELTRLKSHIAFFNETIDLKKPVGRELDFIVQEMNREINTIGSKSTDNEVSQWAIKIKSELEKIKEQIQNVE